MGFRDGIEAETVPRGLNEAPIRLISAKKLDPTWMLEWRLNAYRNWANMETSQGPPKWANIHYPGIDYQDMIY